MARGWGMHSNAFIGRCFGKRVDWCQRYGGDRILFSGSRGKGRNGISMPCWGMPVNRLIKKKARASMVDMHGFV